MREDVLQSFSTPATQFEDRLRHYDRDVARHLDGTTLPPRGRDHFSGDFNVGRLMMTVVDSSVKSAGDVW